MKRVGLYLDEDVPHGVAAGLRRRGYDVLTTIEAGRSARTDEDQLELAVARERCIFTFNRGHFARLHAERIARGEHHFGIIVAPQMPVGPTVRLLAALLSHAGVDGLQDKLVWLRRS